MKKLTYFISAISVLLATSCTNELETNMQEGKLSFSSINASMADLPTSRVHFEDEGKLVWDLGDKISVYGDNFQTALTIFECTNISESSAIFTSENEVNGSKFLAFYPSGEFIIFNDDLRYTLPKSIEYKDNSCFPQCPMIAESVNNDFRFKQTCGVIRFSITGTKRIVSLVLEGNNNEIITGTGTIDLSTETPSLIIPTNESDAGKTITMSVDNLQLSSDLVTDFYFIVPPIEFKKGLSLTINCLNEDSLCIPIRKSTTKNVVVLRSMMKSFSVLDTDSLIEGKEENIEIPDLEFKKYCIDNFDLNNDNEISYFEAENVTAIDCRTDNITSLKGIEFFTNLYSLILHPANDIGGAMGMGGGPDTGIWRDSGYYLNGKRVTGKIAEIDLSKNTQLSYLDCSGNLLTKLNLSNNKFIKNVNASYNLDLSEIILPSNCIIEKLTLTSTSIQEIDLTNLDSLTFLNIDRGLGLNSIDVSKNVNLERLDVGGNNLKTLDVSNNTQLEVLDCCMNQLRELDFTKNPKLGSLNFAFNEIETIDLSNNQELYFLFFQNNKMNHVDVSMLSNLETIHFGNYLKSLDGSIVVNDIKNIDLSNNTKLKHLFASLLDIEDIDISNNTELLRFFIEYNLLDTLDISKSLKLEEFWCYGSPNLNTVYISPEQSFIYGKDDWTKFKYINEGDSYESIDYSADGQVAVLQTASVGSGIDIVLMGDGYSDRLIADGTYDKVMNTAMEKFFSVEPYKSYRNMFNVYSVKAVSKNEEFSLVNETAFSGYFGDGTLVGGNDQHVFNYALKAISEERMDEALVVVMMNSLIYAGTCYMYHSEGASNYGNGTSISYFPVGVSETELAQVLHHEAGGHGFAKLADEYAYEYMGAIPANEVTITKEQQTNWGWWKNVDFTDAPTNVRWNYFLTDNRYANDGLGVYEGGLTYWTGVWRPTENSIMRYNTGGFNAPSREAIYYRIHKLAYGEEWQYDYEKFVEYDAINRSSTAARSVPNFIQKKSLHKPVIIKGSWKDAKSKLPSRSASASSAKIRQKVSSNSHPSSMQSTVFNRVALPNGKTRVTTLETSGKITVKYENK